jgi:hypothetical protein
MVPSLAMTDTPVPPADYSDTEDAAVAIVRLAADTLRDRWSAGVRADQSSRTSISVTP